MLFLLLVWDEQAIRIEEKKKNEEGKKRNRKGVFNTGMENRKEKAKREGEGRRLAKYAGKLLGIK